jgi:acetyltransferase-like isoleucine patch superfamily enzyme
MYTRIIQTLKNFIKRHSGRPAMLYGYKIPGGKYLPNTRVSNMTYIGSPENLKMGDYVYIHHFSFIDCSNGMSIGEGCQIGRNITIATHSSHIPIRLYGRSYVHQKDMVGYQRAPVEIGKYTFLGPNTIIVSGTSIGKGCIVAAFSFVKGEFPDFSIIAGNPAKIVGSTKDMDKKYLNANPELLEHYNSWALDSND